MAMNQIVVDDGPITGLAEQLAGMAADVACTAGDEDGGSRCVFHRIPYVM
jgi:hypothetical protein